jgi:phage/plasmid-like protein (TIGR03299 family)
MDNIDMTGGKANMAFLGDRNAIWHRMGEQMKEGMTTEEWATASGLTWTAEKVPAFAQLDDRFPNSGLVKAEGRYFLCRNDNGYILSPTTVSNVYQAVQPAALLGWFDRYVSVDSRFKLDVCGSLKKGEIIWATAIYQEPVEVAGDKHVMRLLMTTTFDGSGATINKGCTERVVCNNTLDVALGEKHTPVIRTRHNTKFDAAKVAKELAAVAQGFSYYKKMGDALAQNEMAKDEVSRFFKSLLDIPFEAKPDDVSTRKMNQFHALSNAYRTSIGEGATGAWAALNAVTRYVDHDRSVKTVGSDITESRFLSSQFGSGHLLKSKAVGLLMPRIKDLVLA